MKELKPASVPCRAFAVAAACFDKLVFMRMIIRSKRRAYSACSTQILAKASELLPGRAHERSFVCTRKHY
eukprot:6189773-Pleurochrysis_carterae.AAC.2